MSHLALYRKWRPARFGQVCGQDPVTSVLAYQVMTGKTSHAYLFTGSRGTGKTSCAKILARAVNCLAPENGEPCGKCEACLAILAESATDVVEMDAASNNGVEYIRDIREEVVYTPAMLKNRVYIIDEVHMLSVSAFNALLKTLEEPPERVVFILATTELHKIPATILSRCQRFDFRRLSTADIAEHLSKIAEAEGIAFEKEGLVLIARLAKGGMRDAISMLELCASGGQVITADLVQTIAGVSGFDQLADLVGAVNRKDFASIFALTEELCRSSRDLGVFLTDLLGFYRDLLILHTVKEPDPYLDLTEREKARLETIAQAIARERVLSHIRLLENAFVTLTKGTADKRLILEMALMRLCDDALRTDTASLLARVAALESAIASGAVVTARPAEVSEQAQAMPESPKPAEMPLRSAKIPAEIPEKSSERLPEAAKPAQSAVPAPSSRPIPDFVEAVRAMEQTDMSAASILKSAGAALCGEVVVIGVENEFFRRMIERDAVKDALLGFVNRLDSLGGTKITKIEIRTVKKSNGDDGMADLSEFG